MTRISLLSAAHDQLRDTLKPGDIAIDATIGNGHDTLFLAEQVSPSGHVYGFDIQPDAIAATRKKIPALLINSLTLFNVSHAEMANKIPVHLHGNIKAIMFNLGYLPGGDKSIITLTDTTLTALNVASQILTADNGIITVLAYPGHSGGAEETDQVQSWCQQLDPNQFSFNTLYSTEHKDSAPRLFVIRKRL